jgi:membrane peptidoglycan carboxypeptidase
MKLNRKPSSGGQRRRPAGTRIVTTRSGKVLKVHQSLSEKWVTLRAAKSRRKVDRMRGLPKSRFKRVLWRLRPSHLKEYWFSRDGGIMALKIVGISILVFFLLTMAVFAYFRKDMPNISDISGNTMGGSISYYDRTGNTLLWQDYNAIKRVPVQSKDISQYLKDATIATEDRNFYNERGFDVKSIARAAINNVFNRGSKQGGSTITQQLVKLTQNWTQQRTYTRKAKELILSVEVERTYTKDQILTGYLNVAPYGGVDYGVQAAASDYFHKSAKDVTLPEAAMLAAIPKSPAYYSPYNTDYFNKPAFIGRYYYVLDSMVETGKITKKQADAAKKVDILAEVQPQQSKFAGIQAPYFVLAAKNDLMNKLQQVNNTAKVGGWKVTTTVDMKVQAKAEEVVQSNRSNTARYNADEEAIVAEDVKTGQMLALVGGTDFNNPDHGHINYAQWNVSPGSSFKPYDYSTLIENHTNAGAGSVLYDSRGPIPGYPCTSSSNCLHDFDYRYPGALTLRYAIGGSRNVPAVKAMLSVYPGKVEDSVNKVLKTTSEMMYVNDGYKCYKDGTDTNTATTADETQCYGASAIGDGAYLHLDQHLNGLATLGRLGQAIPATYLMKVQDSAGKSLYDWAKDKDKPQYKPKQVIRAETAYIMDNMLSDPNASYLGGSYYKWHHYGGWNTAIKTGTTNNAFDGLMMSWNTQYAVGSWVGNHSRTVALTTSMENMTTPLTRGLMTYLIDNSNMKPQSWAEPSGIQHLSAYHSAMPFSTQGPAVSTDIYPSWYKRPSVNVKSQIIDKISNKLATDCTPALARQTVGGNSTANAFSIDIFYPPGANAAATANTNTAATDDVHSCSDSKPLVTVTADPSGTITVAATAGSHPFSDSQYALYPGTMNISVDGKVVKTYTDLTGSSINRSFSYNFTPGEHTVTAQVIDSVLYDSSDSTQVSVVQPSTSLNFTSVTTNDATWTGGTGPYTVKHGGTTLCTTSGTSCTFKNPVNHGDTVKITDSASNTTTGQAQM